MNMVRNGVVKHSSDWSFGGCQELCGKRKRYQIIDQDRLLNFLEQQDLNRFREWYMNTLNELCSQDVSTMEREKYWSKSFAVGSPEWFSDITLIPDHIREKYIKPVDSEESGTYVFNPPQTVLLKMWKLLKLK